MMTPIHPIYAVLTLYGICFFGGAFIIEMVASLRDNHWNVIKTLVEFLKDF